MIEEIDVATTEQTQGMDQINSSVAQIDSINQENAKHAESNATASVSLNNRSGNLISAIDELGLVLRNIVGGRGGQSVPPPSRESRSAPRRVTLKALPPPK